MSTKAKKTAAKAEAPSKKSAAPAKAEKKAGKAAKAAAADDEASEPVEGAEPQVDLEELEEQQEEAAAAASSSGSNAAALAAAGSGTEMSASFKNFRHHPDMENFYRFIFENDLRHEALAIIDEIMVEKAARKLAKSGGKSAH